MLIGLLGTLLGVIIAGALLALRQRNRTSGHGSDITPGDGAAIPCVIHVDGRWRHGKLTLTPELALWRPRFGNSGATTLSLATTTVMDRRAVTPREAIAISPNLTVLILNSQGKRVEIAVLPRDLPLLDKAFDL